MTLKRTMKISLVGDGGVGTRDQQGIIARSGDGDVGKTSLSKRLATGIFIETSMTVGFDIETWTIEDGSENGPILKASLFDMGGQEQFRFFQDSLLKGSMIVLLVFDVSIYRTFIALDDWLPLINDVGPERIILVGNKIDQGLVVTEQEISMKADELKVNWILISAKTGEGFGKLEKLVLDIVGLETT